MREERTGFWGLPPQTQIPALCLPGERTRECWPPWGSIPRQQYSQKLLSGASGSKQSSPGLPLYFWGSPATEQDPGSVLFMGHAEGGRASPWIPSHEQ